MKVAAAKVAAAKVLVKLGGALLDTPEMRQSLATQIAEARARGVELVVVHGGGKQMTRYLAERGIESRFVDGLRVTTPQTIDAVLKVFAGSINHELVASVNRAGAPAVGLSGIDAFLTEAEQMDPALGAVGRVTRCNAALLNLLVGNGYVPVVACVAGDRAGNIYNVNADQMAVACAAGFGARQLVFLTDVEGVLDASRDAGQAQRRIVRADGGRGAGAHRAGRGGKCAGQSAGGGRDRNQNGVTRGASRMISGVQADAFVEAHGAVGRLDIRKAVMRDIPPILDLINSYAAKGVMLPRTEFEMSEAIRDFTVVTQGSSLLGCGALHFYSPTVAEIRSLAVAGNAKTQGVGRKLVSALILEAQAFELDAVFAFTYVEQFFQKVGFQVVERGALPLKAWKDCLRCPKFQACDEIAVLRVLRPGRWNESQSNSRLPTMTI